MATDLLSHDHVDFIGTKFGVLDIYDALKIKSYQKIGMHFFGFPHFRFKSPS